jgi:hypothetical protein
LLRPDRFLQLRTHDGFNEVAQCRHRTLFTYAVDNHDGLLGHNPEVSANLPR